MENYNGKSLIDITEEILIQKKGQENMYELFDLACSKKNISANQKNELLAQYYTDLISSAKFVYLGDNDWDLKNNQDISLWEKDGSFYKEYNEVEMPVEEVKPAPTPKVEKVVPEVKVKEVVAKPVVEVVAETVAKEVVEEKPVAKVVSTPETPEAPAVAEKAEFDEELFEEYDDGFDEEKYNEYMDTYEDQYED